MPPEAVPAPRCPAPPLRPRSAGSAAAPHLQPSGGRSAEPLPQPVLLGAALRSRGRFPLSGRVLYFYSPHFYLPFSSLSLSLSPPRAVVLFHRAKPPRSLLPGPFPHGFHSLLLLYFYYYDDCVLSAFRLLLFRPRCGCDFCNLWRGRAAICQAPSEERALMEESCGISRPGEGGSPRGGPARPPHVLSLPPASGPMNRAGFDGEPGWL